MRKKWVAYQEIKNGRKHKKRKEDQMIDRRKKIRDQLRPWMGRDVNFVDEFTHQESALHMGRNATNAKRRITGEAVV